MKKINVCFSPALYPYYVDNNDIVVVVVDVFRATTSMCVALSNGASGIIPVATMEEAKAYKDKGYLVGGERNIVKFEFGDFGNTPSEYTQERVNENDIVVSTTNGTHAIDVAQDASNLIIGSFSNLQAVANYCLKEKKDVLVLCAGWKDQFNMEDALFGGALIELLTVNNEYQSGFDAATVSLSMWKEAKPDMKKFISQSEHINRMKQHGLYDVALFCLQTNTTNVVPVYDKNKKIIKVAH